MKPTAVIYARVSTAEQAEEGISLDSQIEQGRKKAEALGATVLREFMDEGRSGRTSKRPQFQQAIAFCYARKVDYFIIWNSARFARNRIDAPTLKLALRKAGTKISYVSMQIDPNTDEGWLTEAMIELMDENHSRQVAKDTKRSMLKNAEDGYFNGGSVPYGYNVVPVGRRKRLQVNELEAPIVRRIFDLYVNKAMSLKTVARQLNDAGLTKRGDRWNYKGIGLILKNYRYIGISIFNRRDHQALVWRDRAEWVIAENSHEPIIDGDMFARAQRILGMRAPDADTSCGSPKSQFVFTGLLRCHCGAKMKIQSATGRSKTYRYYNCSTAMDGGACKGRSINASLFDPWMVSEIVQELLTAERVEEIMTEMRTQAGSWAEERQETRALLVRELREVEAKRDKLFEVLEAAGKATEDLAGVTERLKKHRLRAAEIEASLHSLESYPDVEVGELGEVDLEEAIDAVTSGILDCESPERQRLFMSEFIEKVEIAPDGVKVIYHPDRLLTMNPEVPVHSKGKWLPRLGSNQRPTD